QVRPGGNYLLQTLALDQLHRDIRSSGFLPHVIDGYDIGMLQTSGGLGFTVEARQQVGIVGHSGGDGLEGYKAIDDRVAGAIDNPHPAAAQFADEFVFAELSQFLRYRLKTRNGQNSACSESRR